MYTHSSAQGLFLRVPEISRKKKNREHTMRFHFIFVQYLYSNEICFWVKPRPRWATWWALEETVWGVLNCVKNPKQPVGEYSFRQWVKQIVDVSRSYHQAFVSCSFLNTLTKTNRLAVFYTTDISQVVIFLSWLHVMGQTKSPNL